MIAVARNFDTVDYIHKLKSVNFTQEQAEMLAQQAEQAIVHDVASKNDLNEVKSELKQDIANVRTELKQDIANVRNDLNEVKSELKQDIANVRIEIANVRNNLILWVVGTGVGAIVTLSGLMITLFKTMH